VANQVGVDFLPPEVRRYRQDLGEQEWERVFDFRDAESGPDWPTTGIRSMCSYKTAADGKTYLYFGTFGLEPSVWRSPTGEPGTWEKVFANTTAPGSVRGLTVHNGLLYMAVTHEVIMPRVAGEVYATDGETFWTVNDDGFGNIFNEGVYSLESFNGYLYAGTHNRTQGFEVWKMEGPDGAPPVKIADGGVTDPANQSIGSMVVFEDHLYCGSLIFAGINIHFPPLLRGADMIRINADDEVEVIVGPGSLGGYRSGFGSMHNAYIWSLEVHEDYIYCGTWDSARTVRLDDPEASGLTDVLNGLANGIKERRNQREYYDLYDLIKQSGASLYRSSDGVRWIPIFQAGLGNPDNYGVRNMVSHDGTLYIGMANPFDGLEVWKMD
jgi:hypothetical protein